MSHWRRQRSRARQLARDRYRKHGWQHVGTALAREYAQRHWRHYLIPWRCPP